MRHVGVTGLVLAAALVFGALAAGSASAKTEPCWRVLPSAQGNRTDPHCLRGTTGSYVRGTLRWRTSATGEGCIQTEVAGTGNFAARATCEGARDGTGGVAGSGNWSRVVISESCPRVRAGTGDFTDDQCMTPGRGNWAKVVLEVLPVSVARGISCLPVAEPGTGTYVSEEACSEGGEEVAEGEFIRAFWEEPETGPQYFFCHKVTLKGDGSFTSDECSSAHQETGGEWASAYADDASSLSLCSNHESGQLFSSLLCSQLASGEGGSFELESQNAPTPTLLGSSRDTATLKGEISGAKTEIGCRSGKFSAQPEANGKSSGGRLEYTSCTVGKPTSCSVKEPIAWEFNGQLLEASDKVTLTGSGEPSGTEKEVLAEMEFEGGSCALAGHRFPLQGSQTCTGATGILTLKASQELLCEASGSSLKLSANKATYENKLSLDATSKELWAVLRLST